MNLDYVKILLYAQPSSDYTIEINLRDELTVHCRGDYGRIVTVIYNVDNFIEIDVCFKFYDSYNSFICSCYFYESQTIEGISQGWEKITSRAQEHLSTNKRFVETLLLKLCKIDVSKVLLASKTNLIKS